ncbi:MAG: acetylornithine deacetylase [Pseudomonadota bacterium]
MRSIEILDHLIAFPTIARSPNIELISFCRELLGAAGVESTLIASEDGRQANLYATIGPQDRPGVMLSGHTDVVPVEGQAWSVDPFKLTERDGKLFGRGAADMKGFVASALAMAEQAATRNLTTPLHLALSYDEEIGCVGVRSMIDMLEQAPIRPAMCIVGEPTGLAVATGHKGKTDLRGVFTGKEAHSALAPTGVNAIYLASEFVEAVRALQSEIVETGPKDGDYDVPYTTLHVGKIAGGVAINIVPNRCEIAFEIRSLAGDDPRLRLDKMRAAADLIEAQARQVSQDAGISIEVTNTYPGLDTPPDAAVVDFVKGLTGVNGTIKVAFGTEGGLFQERLGTPTVVCGPGSMAQGHKPDEFVDRDQIDRCDEMLGALLTRLEHGL